MQNKSKPNTQSGAALLLMLLALLLAGVGASLGSTRSFDGSTQLNQHHVLPGRRSAARHGLSAHVSNRYGRAARDFAVLIQAKTALLAYAVTYADNYNPTGAGPGHLPCPDLDAPDDGNTGNDGPNPPCGSETRQIGRIPRLTTASRDINESVSLPDNRLKVLEFYPLLTSLDRQPWYTIDGQFINNPLNRPVNSKTQSRFINAFNDPLVALLSAPGEPIAGLGQQRPGTRARDYLEQYSVQPIGPHLQTVSRDTRDDSNDLVLPVYQSDLLPLVERRVAGFVKRLLLDYRQQKCPRVNRAQENDAGGVTHAEPVFTTHCFPYAALPREPGESGDGEGAYGCELNRLVGRLPLSPGSCGFSLTVDGKLESIPLERHWFYRNHWADWVNYKIANVCIQDIDHLCVVVTTFVADTSPDERVQPNVQVSIVLSTPNSSSSRVASE